MMVPAIIAVLVNRQLLPFVLLQVAAGFTGYYAAQIFMLAIRGISG
jgi:hypothetical protein